MSQSYKINLQFSLVSSVMLILGPVADPAASEAMAMGVDRVG